MPLHLLACNLRHIGPDFVLGAIVKNCIFAVVTRSGFMYLYLSFLQSGAWHYEHTLYDRWY